jgi:tellurite resistance protein
MNDEMAARARWQPLDHLPIGLFGAVMGLTGLSVAWHLAGAVFGAPPWIADAIGATAVLAFVAVTIGYAIKIVTAPQAVAAEFHHPIAGSLFGTFFISLLLLPIILAPVNLSLARWLWVPGAIGMMVFAWLIVSRWMSEQQELAHATPAWIVPVVGLLDVPLAVPSLGFAAPPGSVLHALMVMDLAVGLFFAIPLFTLIFARLVFQPRLPDALQPTLLILVAPFAVGYSTYTVTVGTTDLFAQSLYLLTLFMLAVLLGRLRTLGQCCPFRFGWWSVSFPLAASAIAALRYAAVAPGWLSESIAVAALALATTTIAGLLLRTLTGIAFGELRTLSS